MKRTLLFLFFIVPMALLAQKRFTSGQIVTAEGEILKGEIDYREWVVNPSKIRFKKEGVINTLRPQDLRSFKIDSKNEIYETAVVLVNQEALDWEEMPQYQTYAEVDGRIDMKVDTVFLMVLTRGALNLYQLIDTNKRTHYYFRKGNGSYEPLIYRKVKIMRPGQLLMADVLEDNNLPRSIVFEDFKGQLKYVLGDCGMLGSAIDKLTYSRSILDVVNRYNECRGQVIYVKPKDRAKHFAYVSAGRVQSSFAIADANNSLANTLPDTWATTFGLGIEFGIPRSRGKFNWGIEALFMNANSSAITTSGPLDIGARDARYALDVRGVRISALLKYNFITGNFQPYVKGGIGNLSYSASSYEVQDVNTGQMFEQRLLKSEPYLVGGAGIKVYDFFAEARYATGNDINRTTGYDTKMEHFSILIGYALALTK
ncbi:MAG: hypothetical protein HRU41_13050 [Saprospiraceae bacterium]|nr:hypothetical protein [Saprospiraceae bacterium]